MNSGAMMVYLLMTVPMTSVPGSSVRWGASSKTKPPYTGLNNRLGSKLLLSFTPMALPAHILNSASDTPPEVRAKAVRTLPCLIHSST